MRIGHPHNAGGPITCEVPLKSVEVETLMLMLSIGAQRG